MKFSVISAVDKNFGIGKGGKLPWNLKGDMAHFKEVTTRGVVPGKQNVVIMGRTTWESLPERYRPLPGRLNVVLSRQSNVSLPTGVMQFGKLEEAIATLTSMGVGEIFVIGGGQVYAQAVANKNCQTIYLTEIDAVFDCDAYFPKLPTSFRETANSNWIEDSGIKYKFVIYKRDGQTG